MENSTPFSFHSSNSPLFFFLLCFFSFFSPQLSSTSFFLEIHSFFVDPLFFPGISHLGNCPAILAVAQPILETTHCASLPTWSLGLPTLREPTSLRPTEHPKPANVDEESAPNPGLNLPKPPRRAKAPLAMAEAEQLAPHLYEQCAASKWPFVRTMRAQE